MEAAAVQYRRLSALIHLAYQSNQRTFAWKKKRHVQNTIRKEQSLTLSSSFLAQKESST